MCTVFGADSCMYIESLLNTCLALIKIQRQHGCSGRECDQLQILSLGTSQRKESCDT